MGFVKFCQGKIKAVLKPDRKKQQLSLGEEYTSREHTCDVSSLRRSGRKECLK